MASALNLHALAGARMEVTPFRWGFVEDAVAPAAAEALRASFPERGFWRLKRGEGENPMDFRIRPLVVLGADDVAEPGGLEPAWVEFAHELLGPAYREAAARAIGADLGDALLEASVWRWGADAHLGVHPDIPRKIASHVFYFNEEWDCSWGGCLRILASQDPDDCVAELPPALGSASLIVRSDASWHAVPPVRRDTGERLSVVATWQHAGTDSPFWTVQDDGAVVCHARGASRDG